ncbi:MAG: leucine-rich repeat protein [Candidatus Helarchaeota archaeon]|nr:leucine-rich repeat protein [Candidatus Helarchaeota archaeon]
MCPDLANCAICGEELTMPFFCKQCKKPFCVDHRIPEAHKCEKLKSIRRTILPEVIKLKPEIKDPFVIVRGRKIDVKIGIQGYYNLFLQKYGIREIKEIERLGEIEILDYLNLRDNLIKKIEGLDSLEGLKILDLSRNQITEIDGLESLQKLKVLNLSGNRIQSMKGLKYLTNLRRLFLDHNQITEVSDIDYLPYINVVSLRDNPISLKDSNLLGESKFICIEEKNSLLFLRNEATELFYDILAMWRRRSRDWELFYI